jgi:voltage-gated potassium channel Kch
VEALGTVVATAAGLALIALAGRDIFDALFHPEGRGALARLLARAVWRVFRRARPGPRTLALAGPLALVVVIASWSLLLALGWALVYLPHMDDGFRGAPGTGFVDALNFSLVTLTTLGFGDVVPASGWLRVVTPFEALVGFGLLSASISWLLLVYPVIARRRSLAYEVRLLRDAEAEEAGALAQLGEESLERLYQELTSRLVAVERDLVNFPITYYFADGDERFSLPAVAPDMLTLAEEGASQAHAGARLRARLLRQAVDDFAATTASGFHGSSGATTEELLQAYARDHLASTRR